MTVSQDRLQRTAVYATKIPELVITHPTFVYVKVICDGKSLFCVTELASRVSSYLVS